MVCCLNVYGCFGILTPLLGLAGAGSEEQSDMSRLGIFQDVNTGMLYSVTSDCIKGRKFQCFLFRLLHSSSVLIDAPEVVMALGILG